MLSGADDRVFCNCGDQGIHERQSNGSGTVGMAVEELRVAIRDALVPVIVRVQGYAIGWGDLRSPSIANLKKRRKA